MKKNALNVEMKEADNPAYWMQLTIMHLHDLMRYYLLNKNNDASISRLRILSMLKASGPVTLKELSSRLLLSTPSLCITLNKLVKAGLVLRKPDEKDRRNIFFLISEDGKIYLKEATAEMVAHLEEAMKGLSDSDKLALKRNLSSTYEIISQIF